MTPERATAPRPAGGTHRAAAVALVVSMALLAGCGGSGGKITLNRGDSSDTVPEVSTGPDGTAPTTGSLTWGSCSKFDIAVTADVLSSARQSGLECAALDVPVSSWMRAPGHCPGMFAGETAMDELAVALGMDPLELRLRNEPEVDPESGLPFSSRGLLACLRAGAERFGWAGRDPAPRTRR